MEKFLFENFWLIALMIVWTLPWKGWALWKASQLGDKRWFIALLIINTLGLLEILYIFVLSKPRVKVRKEVVEQDKNLYV